MRTRSPRFTAAEEPLNPVLLPRPRMLGLAVRVVMLVLVGVLSLSRYPTGYTLVWLALIAAAAAPAILAPEHRVIGPLSRLAEVVTTCLAAAAVGEGPAAAAVLPYLTVPVVSATLMRRRFEVPVQLVAAVAILTTAGIFDQRLRASGYTWSSLQWFLLRSEE